VASIHIINGLGLIIGEVVAGRPRSAGGVPALGKRHQRPRGPVVVGGTR